MSLVKITSAEAQIMDVLWRADRPLAVEDLQEGLKGENWADGTIRAFLARMLRKKAVAAIREGKRQFYRPLLARGDYVFAESKGLIDRLFDGKLAPFVTEFSERQDLDADDIAKLRHLLERLENGK
jgi:BlaI family penicillinase repressor